MILRNMAGWTDCAGPNNLLAEIARNRNDHLLNIVEIFSNIDGMRSMETFIYLRINQNFSIVLAINK